MKKGDLDKWIRLDECKNLLFFSQLVNELLFDYSIPSNRISTLNSHFLCLDALSAIGGIERHGVPEGTLKPIAEELYEALSKDPVFQSTTESPLKYFIKYGDPCRISSKVSDLNYDELKKAIRAVNTKFFIDNKYYHSLHTQISDLIIKNEESDQPKLFRLIKSLLTELVNLGYSQTYIYKVMTTLFWKPQNPVISPTIINDFFQKFSFEKGEYTVALKINKRSLQKFLQFIELPVNDKLDLRTQSHIEKQFASKGTGQAFLLIDYKALDPFKAAQTVKENLSTNIAFYRLYDHEYRYNIDSAKCGVYDGENFYRVHQTKSAVFHTKIPSNKQISEKLHAYGKALSTVSRKDIPTLIHTAIFHAQALDSTSSENQLLDLWALFETVLDISNRHTADRIVQVCTYLVPILKRKYIYSLFLQLSNDIKNYSDEKYNDIIGSSISEREVVQHIFEFVTLNENVDKRLTFLKSCSDFPLLRERIEYYSIVFEKPLSVYNFVEKHAKSVKWQIMRIYRNRNLIIHNGDSMPYLDLLIENLHSYVDDFLEYTIESLARNRSVDNMCQELFVNECDWISDFSRNKNKELSKEDVLKILAI